MSKKQLSLNLFKGKLGGRRPNSGRKRLHSKGVAHRNRERVTHRTPVHINFKVKTYIRNKDCLRILGKAIQNARQKGLRVIHYSLQSNHIHLIIEPISNEILSTGMRALTITFAKRVQKLKQMKGGIQLERYHLHVLRSISEARNAINYVLFNEQKHAHGKAVTIDGFSSLASLKLAKEYAKPRGLMVVLKRVEALIKLDPASTFYGIANTSL